MCAYRTPKHGKLLGPKRTEHWRRFVFVNFPIAGESRLLGIGFVAALGVWILVADRAPAVPSTLPVVAIHLTPLEHARRLGHSRRFGWPGCETLSLLGWQRFDRNLACVDHVSGVVLVDTKLGIDFLILNAEHHVGSVVAENGFGSY